MKQKVFIILVLTVSLNSVAQNKSENEVISEGAKLYKSEMASWYGTDIFMAQFPDKRANSAGYFSYNDGGRSKCIFFSKGDNPKALVTISFDSTYSTTAALVDGHDREFTELEMALYSIRTAAFSAIQADTLFKRYKNTTLNLIPISDDLGKRVYILTGPQNNGVVIFGNDYLITFDKENRISAQSKLHKSLIPIEYGSKDGMNVFGSVHTHLSEYSSYITATDICTLRLYEKIAKWKQHYVMSEKFVSIWNCDVDRLTIMTKVAWDKINAKQKEKN